MENSFYGKFHFLTFMGLNSKSWSDNIKKRNHVQTVKVPMVHTNYFLNSTQQTTALNKQQHSTNKYMHKVNKRKTRKKVWNVFKVNNKDTKTTSMTWTRFYFNTFRVGIFTDVFPSKLADGGGNLQKHSVSKPRLNTPRRVPRWKSGENVCEYNGS